MTPYNLTQVSQRTLSGSHILWIDWCHSRAAMMIRSSRNCVFNFWHLRDLSLYLKLYLHIGNSNPFNRRLSRMISLCTSTRERHSLTICFVVGVQYLIGFSISRQSIASALHSCQDWQSFSTTLLQVFFVPSTFCCNDQSADIVFWYLLTWQLAIRALLIIFIYRVSQKKWAP